MTGYRLTVPPRPNPEKAPKRVVPVALRRPTKKVKR